MNYPYTVTINDKPTIVFSANDALEIIREALGSDFMRLLQDIIEDHDIDFTDIEKLVQSIENDVQDLAWMLKEARV